VFCPSCGTEAAEGAQFCPSCGTAIKAPEVEPPPMPEATPPPMPAAPLASAYAEAVPVAPAPVKKKKRGCVIALAVLGVLLFCCIGSAAAAFIGLKSVGKPRDLGVTYTEADYQSATAKLGIDMSMASVDSPTAKAPAPASGTAPGDPAAGDPAAGEPATGGTAGGTKSKSGTARKGTRPVTQGPAKGTQLVFEGTKPIDVTLTSSEVSALINLHVYSPNWIVQDLQVRFGENGTLEVSGYAVWDGQIYPGYALGSAQLTGPRSVGGTVTTLEAVGVEIPADYNEFAADYLTGGLNDLLIQIEGLDITSATIEGGQLHIVGTAPAKVIRVLAEQ
jgi:hypothetical protein